MYRRRYTRRRYTRRPRRVQAKGRGWGQIARRALKVANFVRSVINPEYKFKDSVLSSTTSILQTGLVTWPCNITQGTTDTTRIGDQFRAKGLVLRGNFEWNSAGAANQYIRMIVFKDISTNGTLPLVQNVLQTGTLQVVRANRNLDFGKRFTVLKDKVYALNNQRPSIYIKEYFKLGHIIEYQGNAGNISDASTGHIFVLFVSSEATSNGPGAFIDSRLKYVDN